MAIKDYLKNVGTGLNIVAKSIFGISPNISMGVSMFGDKVFRWALSGNAAYSNKIFYTGANIIVRKMIEAPITFNKKKKTSKGMSKFYSKSVSNPERSTIKASALDQIEDHELSVMFTLEMMEDFWHNYNFGSGFLWFETLGDELSRNKKPINVRSLRPDRITIITNNNKFDNVDHYQYTCLNGETLKLDPEYVLHLKHWNPNIDSSLKGYGVDVVCAKDIALNDAGNLAEGQAYVQGGRGTLFSSKVEFTGADGTVTKTKWSKEQVTAMQSTIDNDMAGARNNRRMLMTNGEVVVTPYGDTLAEMEVNKSEDSRWKNIFAIMGVPKELSPAEFSSSENSVDAGYKALVTNLIISELRKFDEKLTAKVKQWWSDIVAVSDITEYSELAPDLKLMKEVFGSPSISEDERRKIFGYDEIGGGLGKAILVPSGMMLLSDIVSGEFETDPSATSL